MSDLYYSVAAEVFSKYPGYVRGVVLAYDVNNREAPPELVDLMRAAEAGVRERLDLANIAEQPRIRAWREAYRLFGAKPSEFRSSIEAMARRALRSDPLPSINALVDIGNVVSLEHLLPAGAHAIDVITEDLALRPATGTETFVALGSETVERPEPGEIVFAQGNRVLTRRWTWRQGLDTLTQIDTRAVEFNVDGLTPVTVSDVEAACAAVTQLVERFCGGRIHYDILSPENPRIKVNE